MYLRRCCVVRHLTLTNGCRSCVGIPSVRLVIETMSNPKVYCSWASSSVHIYGPHWTMNSSTCVKRRLCLTFLGSARVMMVRMDAFPPGASLPQRGAMVGVGFRLEAGLRVFPFFFLGLKWRASDSPTCPFLWSGAGGGHVVSGFCYGRLPRCHAYSLG